LKSSQTFADKTINLKTSLDPNFMLLTEKWQSEQVSEVGGISNEKRYCSAPMQRAGSLFNLKLLWEFAPIACYQAARREPYYGKVVNAAEKLCLISQPSHMQFVRHTNC